MKALIELLGAKSLLCYWLKIYLLTGNLA